MANGIGEFSKTRSSFSIGAATQGAAEAFAHEMHGAQEASLAGNQQEKLSLRGSQIAFAAIGALPTSSRGSETAAAASSIIVPEFVTEAARSNPIFDEILKKGPSESRPHTENPSLGNLSSNAAISRETATKEVRSI